MASTPHYYISDRDAAYKLKDMQFGTKEFNNGISYGSISKPSSHRQNASFSPLKLAGLEAAKPIGGWFHVRCPGTYQYS